MRFQALRPSSLLTLPKALVAAGVSLTAEPEMAIGGATVVAMSNPNRMTLIASTPSNEVDELVERHLAEPFAGCSENGVGQRRRRGRYRRFTDPAHGAVFERAHLEPRALEHSHRLVLMVVALLDDAISVGELTVHCVTEPPYDAALHEVFEVDGINYFADVSGDPYSLDANPTIGLHDDFDPLRNGDAERLDECDAPPAAVAERAVPGRHLSDRSKNVAAQLRIAQLNARLQGVAACGVNQLVDE